MSEASAIPPGSRPLRFEHLVQINDRWDPALAPLSRRQLWRGLMIRAEEPEFFMPWLRGADVRHRDDGTLERVLDFGSYQVRDRVAFLKDDTVHYQIEETDPLARSTLEMRIEEPEPGALFVRFVYETHSVDHHADSPLAGYIKEAYRCADQDTIAGIRQLAASGELED